MAKYRPTFTKIWDDPDFQEYSKDEKLMFFFLYSNALTSESGIYAVSYRSIANATNVELDIVEKTLRENKLKNVMYDHENKVVFICNFLRYNGRGRPDLAAKSIYNDYKHVKTSLWAKFEKVYPQLYELVLSISKALEKTSIPKPNLTVNPISILTSNRNSNHTHTVEGESSKNIPVDIMLAVFEKHWNDWNKDSYLHDYETEVPVAEILYKQCLKNRPKDPLGLFEEKVAYLVMNFDVRQFAGLHKFWNAAAQKDWGNTDEKEKKDETDRH